MKKIYGIILLCALLVCAALFSSCRTGMSDEPRPPFENPLAHTDDACVAHDFKKDVCQICGAAKTPSEGLEFKPSDNGVGVMVSGIGQCKDTQLIIPDTYEGQKVVGVYRNAFGNDRSITAVFLPQTTTSIGDYAFQGCTHLVKVSCPYCIESLGRAAFSGCFRLSDMMLPSGLTVIGDGAFQNCTAFDVTFWPDNLTAVGGSAFEKCQSLTNANLPNTVTSIGYNAFYGCQGLTSVVVPNKITMLDSGVFGNCSNIKKLTLPASLIEVNGSFSGCDGLEEVHFMGTLEQWCRLSFGKEDNPVYKTHHLYLGNELLQGEIRIPEGVKQLGRYCLAGNMDIIGVILPVGFESTSSAFTDCENLAYVVYEGAIRLIGVTEFEGTAVTAVYMNRTEEEAGNDAAYIKGFTKNSGIQAYWLPGWEYDEEHVPHPVEQES